MKITALTENTSSNDKIKAEHGLSLYIETNKHKILFDMGQTEIFAENANNLGVDLSKVDIAILSHGHYDHGGGLEKFIQINETAPIYIHKEAFGEHYNGTDKFIGLNSALAENPRLVYTENHLRIDEELSLFSCNDKKQKYPASGSELTKKKGNTFIADDFRHEQYLLIAENEKRVLISGCSHKGILNIMNWFAPDILIGGFHFSKLSIDENLLNYAKELSHFPAVYYTCHCTGLEQYKFMKNHIKNLNYLSCGDSIEI